MAHREQGVRHPGPLRLPAYDGRLPDAPGELLRCCCALPRVPGRGAQAARAQLFEGLLQLLREDLATGALRDNLPPEHFAFCTCNEYHKNCRVFTEAWPRTLAWVDGAPLVRTLAGPSGALWLQLLLCGLTHA